MFLDSKHSGYNRCLVLALSAFALSVIVSLLFFSQYYNFVAESIGIFSILRVADGLPHISQLGELPSNISPYGAYYYIIFGLIFKILGIKNLYFIALVCRLSSFFIFLACARCGAKLYTSDQGKNRQWLFAYVCLFILSFPIMSFMIRSDWVAFLLEFVALTMLFRGDEKFTAKNLILAGMIFGLAPLFKLNSIGIFSGCCFYLLYYRQWRALFMLVFFCLVTLALGLAASYFHLGQNYFLHVLHSANYGLVPVRQWPQLLERIVVDIVLKNLPFWILFLMGFLHRCKKDGRVKLVATAIAANFIIAAVFQLKIGAGENYFLPCFIAGLLLFPHGWEWMKLNLPNDKAKLALQVLITGLVLFQLSITSLSIGGMVYNNMASYPKKELMAYLDGKFPGRKVFTEDANLAVVLYPRVVLGPWDERALLNSKYIRTHHFNGVKNQLAEIDFAAIVVAGSDCSSNLPRDGLAPDFGGKELTLVTFKKICVFHPK